MSVLRRVLSHPTAILAVKAAVAAGVAFFVGSLMPAPLDEYKYYAALGAYTVVGLIVVDSLKESLRVLAAIGIGVGIALLVQTLSWTNPFTVGAAILISVLLAALPVLGEQRSWAPLAALFILATGGSQPQPMALGYLVQIPLGAALGVLVNLVLLAPLGDRDLSRATSGMRRMIAKHMRTYADLLEDQLAEPDDDEAVSRRTDKITATLHDAERAQVHLLGAMSGRRQGQRINPRAHGREQEEERVQHQAEALSRCAAALGAVTVLLRESDPNGQAHDRQVRQDTADVLRTTAELFDDTDSLAEQRVTDLNERLDRIIEQVRHRSGGRAGSVALRGPGPVGATVRRRLRPRRRRCGVTELTAALTRWAAVDWPLSCRPRR